MRILESNLKFNSILFSVFFILHGIEADTRVVVKEEECATQHQPNNPVTDSRWSPVPVTTSVDDSYTGITWRQPGCYQAHADIT